MSSFHVDARINIKMEVELALRLGEMILKSGTSDKQILALGHNLCNIDKEEAEDAIHEKVQYRNRNESSIVSDWQEENRIPVSTMRDKVYKKYAKNDEDKWGVE